MAAQNNNTKVMSSYETIASKAPKRLVPQLRFNEFKEVWKEKEFGEICTIKTGGRDTQDRKEDGEYPFFVRSNTVERIDTYSFDGEAILTSGDGVGVGKNFHYINGKFDYHQRVYALHTFQNNFSGNFAFHLFAEKFYRRVYKLSAKNSVDSVRMEMIAKMKEYFPSLQEQQKIAQFLTAADSKLQQLNQKKELLEQYKKGVMQQLFSQQLRFKKDDGSDYPDWEEKKLGVELEEYKEKSKVNDEFEVLTSSNKGLMLQSEYYGENRLTNRDNKGFNIIPNNFITYRSRSDNRTFTFNLNNLGIKGIISTYYPVFKSKKGSSYFLVELLNNNKNYIGKYSVGTSQTVLSYKELGRIKFKLPCSEEQQKIANYLSAIDSKIETVTQQIETTQQFKKGLLQQMFV